MHYFATRKGFMKLILASGSERRKELLSWLGLTFEVRESGFDETGIGADDVRMLTAALAMAKAQTVADQVKVEVFPTVASLEKELAPKRFNPTYVLGADTVVYAQGEVMGKPKDLDQAREMLKKLRGQTHLVYSGVALIDALTGKQKAVTEESSVTFRDFSDEEMEWYVSTSEPLGKAGAYMVQGEGRRLVASVAGSMTNVIGLPLLRVVDLLADFGVSISVDVPKTIQRKTGFPS